MPFIQYSNFLDDIQESSSSCSDHTITLNQSDSNITTSKDGKIEYNISEPKKTRTLSKDIFKKNQGLNYWSAKITDEVDSFELFINHEIQDLIVNFSNEFGKDLTPPISINRGELKQWIEIKIFFGLIKSKNIQPITKKMPHMSYESWNQNNFYLQNMPKKCLQ